MGISGAKPTIVFEFDKVIYDDRYAWRGHEKLPGELVEGAREFIKFAHQYYKVFIRSNRMTYPSAQEKIEHWLKGHDIPFDDTGLVIPPCTAYISDFNFRFDGWDEHFLAKIMEQHPQNRRQLSSDIQSLRNGKKVSELLED